jgi:multiple sugar transport system ATP-binding protein
MEASRADHALKVDHSNLELSVTNGSGGQMPERVLLGVRPEDVRLTSDGRYSGQVVLVEPLGVETIIHIRAGEQTLLSIVPGAANVRIQDDIRFDVISERLHFFGMDGNRLAV